MTSYPHKVSKSTRQSSRPRIASVSSARASKLREVLYGRGSHSPLPSSQQTTTVHDATNVWDAQPISFDPYATPADPGSRHRPSFDQQSLEFPAYPSPPTQHTGTDAPLSIDQVAGQYDFKQPRDPANPDPSNLQDMSSLSFMVPSHYGSFDHYPGSSYESNYMMNSQHAAPHQQLPPATSAQTSYGTSYTSSPAMMGASPVLNAQRRASSNVEQYQQNRRISQSPYEQPASIRASPASVNFPASSAETSTISHQPNRSASYPNTSQTPPTSLPAPSFNPLQYTSTFPPPSNHYNASNYEMGYNPSGMYSPPSGSGYGAPYLGATTGPDGASMVGTAMPGQHPPSSGAGSAGEGQGGHVRILNTRPKPQCWDHGCNGRQFSTFSNLLRHQREKSGTAAKSVCPRCGAEFTRTTARNGHMENDKCKPRRASNPTSNPDSERKYSS